MIDNKTITSPFIVAVLEEYYDERPENVLIDLGKLPEDHPYRLTVVDALNEDDAYVMTSYGCMQSVHETGHGDAYIAKKGRQTVEGSVTLSESGSNSFIDPYYKDPDDEEDEEGEDASTVSDAALLTAIEREPAPYEAPNPNEPDLATVVADNLSRLFGEKIEPTPFPKGAMQRPQNCGWPWPYRELSNGIQVETQESIKVRSLVDKRAPGGKLVKGKPAMLHLTPSGIFELGDVIENAQEGVHFEVIEGEKIQYADIAARKTINKTMKPTEALARARRELNEHDLQRMMTPEPPKRDMMGLFGDLF